MREFVSTKPISMKTLIVKKEKKEQKVAQCCAKISKNVAGCHD